jgi:subtilisin family serine protease
MHQMVEEPSSVAAEDKRSMILYMASPAEGAIEYSHAATTALARRRLALSARDCLPPDRAPDQVSTLATPRPLLSADEQSLKGSLLVTSTETAAARPVEELREDAISRVSPLLANARVHEALVAKGIEPERVAEDLWASGAIAVDLSPEDVRALREEVPDIAAIYPNRQLRVPPVIEVYNVPEDVRETRVGTWGLKTIGALAAWGAFGARGEGIRVAVLDTGVDANHPDLAGRIDEWAEFDSDGRRVASSPHDPVGHGTHVAGTIAGGNASGQWIGVAPEARLCCGKVLGPDGGQDVQILAGITWAIEQQVDVISMSLGGITVGPEAPATYTQAIVEAARHGIPTVIAIGNDGAETTGSPGNDLFALSVGATDHRDCPAGFSGGRTHIVTKPSPFIDPKFMPLAYSTPDVVAPGVAVVSSYPGGGWKALSGTSMATPHAADAMALVLSATNAGTGVAKEDRAFLLSDLLTGSVEELGEAGQDHRYGFGRIDVLRAIDFARERGY